MDRERITYLLGYAAGFIFVIGIMIYVYLLITDKIEKTEHSTEETIWIWIFLVVLIIGFFGSYYTISQEPPSYQGKTGLQFGGTKKIPIRPTKGHKNMRRDKFAI